MNVTGADLNCVRLATLNTVLLDTHQSLLIFVDEHDWIAREFLRAPGS